MAADHRMAGDVLLSTERHSVPTQRDSTERQHKHTAHRTHSTANTHTLSARKRTTRMCAHAHARAVTAQSLPPPLSTVTTRVPTGARTTQSQHRQRHSTGTAQAQHSHSTRSWHTVTAQSRNTREELAHVGGGQHVPDILQHLLVVVAHCARLLGLKAQHGHSTITAQPQHTATARGHSTV